MATGEDRNFGTLQFIEQFAAALIFSGEMCTFRLFVPLIYERGEQPANLPTSEFIEFFASALMFSGGIAAKRDLAGSIYERVANVPIVNGFPLL